MSDGPICCRRVSVVLDVKDDHEARVSLCAHAVNRLTRIDNTCARRNLIQIDMQRVVSRLSLSLSVSTSFLRELKGSVKWLLRRRLAFRYLNSDTLARVTVSS